MTGEKESADQQTQDKSEGLAIFNLNTRQWQGLGTGGEASLLPFSLCFFSSAFPIAIPLLPLLLRVWRQKLVEAHRLRGSPALRNLAGPIIAC